MALVSSFRPLINFTKNTNIGAIAVLNALNPKCVHAEQEALVLSLLLCL